MTKLINIVIVRGVATSYKFFKSTLNNKVDEYRLEEQADLQHKKELDKYW